MIDHLLIPVVATFAIETVIYATVRISDNGSKNHTKSNAESVVALSTPSILVIYVSMSFMP